MSNGNLSLLLLRFFALSLIIGPAKSPACAANIQLGCDGLYEGMDGKLLENWTSYSHQFHSHRKGPATVWDADLLTVDLHVRDGRNMYIYTALIL